MLEAAGPLGPSTTSNETFCASLRDLKPAIWIELWCANRSLPPSSGVMNPKPLLSLNHLTVPVAMCLIQSLNNFGYFRLSEPASGTSIKGGNRLPLESACGGKGDDIHLT